MTPSPIPWETNRSAYKAKTWWPHPFKTYPGPWKPPGPPAPTGPQLIASSPIENQDDNGTSYGIQGSDDVNNPMSLQGAMQAIQLSKGGKLSSIKFFVNPKGSPTFDVVVELYPTTGGPEASVPSGPALARSDIVNAASFPVAPGLHEFVFTGANQYDLKAGIIYAFGLTYTGAWAPQGQQVMAGIHWAGAPPGNCGYRNYQGWHVDPFGTLTFYLYVT